MVKTKQLNIKNRTYYFYNDLINIKNFDPKLLKLDKKSFKDFSTYYIGYVTNFDILPLNKMLTFSILTFIIRTIFEEDGKYYPQVVLDDCL